MAHQKALLAPEHTEYPPPRGWVAPYGVLLVDSSIGGYLAGCREVSGRCSKQDCRRTCHLNLELLATQGLARIAVSTIARTFKCQRLDGCGLEFTDRSDHGLPLADLARHPWSEIRFTCEACKHAHAARPEAVLAKLKAEARAAALPATAPNTLEKLLAATPKPCGKCGAVRWRIEVLWPDTTSFGFRQGLEARERARAAAERSTVPEVRG